MIAVAVLCGTLCTASSSQAELTGWWAFDEGAGPTAGDSSPSGVDGAITNSETGGLGPNGSVWVNDPDRGSVISFNGAPDGADVRAGSLPAMTMEQDFTWAFWANNMTDVAGQPNNIVIGNRRDGASPEADFVPRQFTKFTPTKSEFHTNGNGDDNLEYEDMPIDQWLHHAVVKEGDLLTYYLNGFDQSSHTLTQSQEAAMPLFFGGDSTSADGENWNGMLDEVRIYDNALSAAEVRAVAGAIPEPSAACLLFAGAACLFLAAPFGGRAGRKTLLRSTLHPSGEANHHASFLGRGVPRPRMTGCTSRSAAAPIALATGRPLPARASICSAICDFRIAKQVGCTFRAANTTRESYLRVARRWQGLLYFSTCFAKKAACHFARPPQQSIDCG